MIVPWSAGCNSLLVVIRWLKENQIKEAADRKAKRKRSAKAMGVDEKPGGHEPRSKPPANLTVPLPGTAGAPPLTWLPGSSSSSSASASASASACVLRPYSRGWPQRLHDILVSAVDHRQRGINLGPGVHLRLAKRRRMSKMSVKADGEGGG